MGNSHVKSVWVLFRDCDYEFAKIIGVFLHKEDAEKLQDAIKKKFRYDYTDVQEFKIIEDSKYMVGKGRRDLNKFFDKYAGV